VIEALHPQPAQTPDLAGHPAWPGADLLALFLDRRWGLAQEQGFFLRCLQPERSALPSLQQVESEDRMNFQAHLGQMQALVVARHWKFYALPQPAAQS
jgi:hypothetical protein